MIEIDDKKEIAVSLEVQYLFQQRKQNNISGMVIGFPCGYLEP